MSIATPEKDDESDNVNSAPSADQAQKDVDVGKASAQPDSLTSIPDADLDIPDEVTSAESSVFRTVQELIDEDKLNGSTNPSLASLNASVEEKPSENQNQNCNAGPANMSLDEILNQDSGNLFNAPASMAGDLGMPDLSEIDSFLNDQSGEFDTRTRED